MLSSFVTSRGQVAIPIELHKKLGVKPGGQVGLVDPGGRIVLRRQETANEAVFGIVKAGRGVALKQMEDAISVGVYSWRRWRLMSP